MNVELKDLLDVAFDGIALGQDALAKNYLSIMGDVAKLTADAPGAIANFPDLQAELNQLQNPANQADLINYIETKFKGQFSSDKAQTILAGALQLVQHLVTCVQDALALEQAIKT